MGGEDQHARKAAAAATCRPTSNIHVIMDNASSHKTRAIRNWFAKRSRWHQYFTPTSSSWLNQVERFFALLADKQIKRGATGR